MCVIQPWDSWVQIVWRCIRLPGKPKTTMLKLTGSDKNAIFGIINYICRLFLLKSWSLLETLLWEKIKHLSIWCVTHSHEVIIQCVNPGVFATVLSFKILQLLGNMSLAAAWKPSHNDCNFGRSAVPVTCRVFVGLPFWTRAKSLLSFEEGR